MKPLILSVLLLLSFSSVYAQESSTVAVVYRDPAGTYHEVRFEFGQPNPIRHGSYVAIERVEVSGQAVNFVQAHTVNMPFIGRGTPDRVQFWQGDLAEFAYRVFVVYY